MAQAPLAQTPLEAPYSSADLRKELALFHTNTLFRQQQMQMTNLYLAWDKKIYNRKRKAGDVVDRVAPMIKWMDENERRERDKARLDQAQASGPKPRGVGEWQACQTTRMTTTAAGNPPWSVTGTT